jgi:hypothetical protein
MKSNKLQTKWMFGVATVLLAVAGFTAARPAQALPQNSAHRIFYSTAAKTHVVGQQDLLYCDGGHGEVEGTKTAYYNTTYMHCP